MNPFITYPDKKIFYPIQIIDLRFQIDHFALKAIKSIEKYIADPGNARLFVILIKHRQFKLISEEKNIQVKVI